MDRQTRQQILKFGLAGLAATAVDFGTYATLLYTILPGAHAVCKGIAYVLGTTVAYLLAKHWTFPDREPVPGESLRFLALYATAAVVNVAVNGVALWVSTGLITSVDQQIAEAGSAIAATSVAMVLNFIGQKFYVFRDLAGPAAASTR